MGLLCRLVRARRGRCREVVLVARCSDGSRHSIRVEGFAPYFYVPSRLGGHRGIDGELLDRVEARCPEDVRELREGYQRTYEADIPYARRFLIDTGIRSYFEYPGGTSAHVSSLRPVEQPAEPIPLRVWYLDIEVLSPSLPDPASPEHPVIMVTYYDSLEGRYVTHAWHRRLRPRSVRGTAPITACGEKRASLEWELHIHSSEKELLESLASDMSLYQPDVVAAWNVGFDWDYLHARAYRLGVRLDRLAVPFDLLEAFRRLGPRMRSYRLKSVTVDLGMECTEDAREAVDELSDWEDNPARGLQYNLRDVWRIVEIDSRFGLVDYFIGIKDLVGIEDISRRTPDGIGLASNLPLIDTLILRIARRRGVALPTASREGRRGEYQGAVVLDPVPGVHEGVAVLDMSRYYPSLIISFNISPETKDRLLDPANGIWSFRHEPRGLLPEAVQYLLELREEMESRLSELDPSSPAYRDMENKIMAVKGLTNSFYGVTANPYFRLYDVDVASTITGLAREGILYVVSQAEEMGYQPLYGDTDSVFVKVPFEEAESLAEELTRRLRRHFMEKYSLPREPMLKLKFEKYYQKIFFKPRTKKRYAGLLAWKKGKTIDPPELDVAGFEAVRTDTAPYTAVVQREILKAVLQGADPAALTRLVQGLAREMRRLPLREIALSAGLSKEPNHYKSAAPQARAAIYSNLYLGTSFTRGSRIRYVFVRGVKCSGLPPTDVVAFDEDTEERVSQCFEVDWERMSERVVYGPAREILEGVGARPLDTGGRRVLTF